LSRVSRLQRQVLEPRGLLSPVLPLARPKCSTGSGRLSTNEIAQQLLYSQRTVKGIVHDITNRFHLRNRSHAVAYAMQEG